MLNKLKFYIIPYFCILPISSQRSHYLWGHWLLHFITLSLLICVTEHYRSLLSFSSATANRSFCLSHIGKGFCFPGQQAILASCIWRIFNAHSSQYSLYLRDYRPGNRSSRGLISPHANSSGKRNIGSCLFCGLASFEMEKKPSPCSLLYSCCQVIFLLPAKILYLPVA